MAQLPGRDRGDLPRPSGNGGPDDRAQLLADVRRGMIPAHIYNDRDVFELEKERVFGRAWLFLGHESEIPAPGDYVVRRILEDSFILARGEDGVARAHFNMCLHRGMQVCRAEMGNASHFRCPYHGWTYRNDGRLAGLPFYQEAYGGEAGFRRTEQRLLPAPRLAVLNGLVFVSLDPDAEPLEDFLGDFRFYLDYYTRQSGSGIELRGPQRWRIRANWKIGAENFAGDMYHTPHTHTSVVEIGLFREPKAEKRKDGCTYWAGAGGGTTYKLPPGDLDERLRYVGYPQEMIDRMKDRLSADQLRVVGEDGFMVSAATIYPNLSFVHNWPKVGDSEDVLPFISIRQWQPISEDETEVLSWFAVDAEAPERFKELSYKAYLMCFGSTGMFEQDDVENWVSLTSTAGGAMARRLLLNGRMGLLEDDTEVVPPLPPERFHGPGVAHTGYGEYNQRALLDRWADDVERAPVRPAPVQLGRRRSTGAPA
jgi:phenylpropionate dioxygenase-like ring-hydroxylating dioxygenase large terminal subunit